MLWAAVALLVALPALAQLRVEVSGVGLTQLPIAIAPFRGQDLAPQKLSAIVQADLERSGQFRATVASALTAGPCLVVPLRSSPVQFLV